MTPDDVDTTPSRGIRRHHWIILYAVAIHLVWALSIVLSDGTSMYTTALSGILRQFPLLWTGVLFFVVAIGALVALRTSSPVLTALLMMPQQFVLLLSAASACEAMIISQFGDGVVRPRTFIIADQAPIVIAAIAHTGALVETFFQTRVRQ